MQLDRDALQWKIFETKTLSTLEIKVPRACANRPGLWPLTRSDNEQSYLR